MQFTKAEGYGIMGVLHLAEKDRADVTPLSEVAELQRIPKKFLAKIFQSLARAGIVRSHRGVRGGFTLARSPEHINVREVLEAIQGPYHLAKCIADPACCHRNGDCSIRDLLLKAESRVVSVFDQHTLADLVLREKAKKG